MIPWKHIDTTRVPGSDGELRLMQRGAEFSIMLGQNELMNSRLSGSEEALATLACRRLEARQGAALLIGGLGMGFTLRAALAVLGRRRGSRWPNWCPPSSPGRAGRWPKSSAAASTIRA